MKKLLLLIVVVSVLTAQAQRRQPRNQGGIDASVLQAKTLAHTEVEKRISLCWTISTKINAKAI